MNLINILKCYVATIYLSVISLASYYICDQRMHFSKVKLTILLATLILLAFALMKYTLVMLIFDNAHLV